MQRALDQLYLRVNRPGAAAGNDDDVAHRSAVAHCILKHDLVVPKNDGAPAYVPSASDIDEALSARTGLAMLFRHGDANRLPNECKKSLTSFSFVQNGFILPPELSNQVISCVIDPTDVAT